MKQSGKPPVSTSGFEVKSGALVASELPLLQPAMKTARAIETIKILFMAIPSFPISNYTITFIISIFDVIS